MPWHRHDEILEQHFLAGCATSNEHAEPRLAAGKFDGFVALGYVIRGETTHYDHICEATAHFLQVLAVEHGLAIGYGILTCENEAQALVRANPRGNRDHGGHAARACLAMIGVKRQFPGSA